MLELEIEMGTLNFYPTIDELQLNSLAIFNLELDSIALVRDFLVG